MNDQKDRELLLRVTRKDFEETHIRGSGPGGQHRNKTSTGVRLRHPASGAVAESTEFKSQDQNRQAAFAKIRETPAWNLWFRDVMLAALGQPSREELLDRAMSPENITTQILDERDRWVTVDPEALS